MKTYYQGVESLNNKIDIANFTITFSKLDKFKKENWISETGTFLVKKNDNKFKMKAERRVYLDTGMPSTEAAIKRNFFSHRRESQMFKDTGRMINIIAFND